jgi:hypothetical protein
MMFSIQNLIAGSTLFITRYTGHKLKFKHSLKLIPSVLMVNVNPSLILIKSPISLSNTFFYNKPSIIS